MKAYVTEWNCIESIILSKNSGRARYETFLAIFEAGYELKIIDIKCKRIPKYDDYEFEFIDKPYDEETIINFHEEIRSLEHQGSAE